MNTLNSLFEWMFLAGLRASLLVLAVLAAQWLLKNRLPSRWRYALWLPVLVALLVPALPLLPSWMSWPTAQADVSEQAASPAPVRPALPAEASQEFALPPLGLRADGSALPPNSIAAPAAAPAAEPEPVNWRAWLMAAWFIGAGGVSLFVVVSFTLTMRRIRSAALPVKAESLAHIAETAQVVGLRRVPRVLQSSAVASPAVCGLWRPTLLLNERFPQDLSADEADMVLRHELTHIRRGDLALNALLCALLALHWWNPLLWLAFFRVRADREAACDAQVLEGAPAARRAAYGHTLLKMETKFPPTGLCLGFVGILQRGGTLRERIHAIISQPQLNQTMKTTITLTIAVLTIVGIAKAAEKNREAKPESVEGKKVSPADADTTAIAAANLGEAKKVTAAVFKEEYEWVGKAQDMHEVSYLGQQNGKAFIRKRSMLHAGSFLPGKAGWSERIIYVQIQDLDAEFRAKLPAGLIAGKALAQPEEHPEANKAIGKIVLQKNYGELKFHSRDFVTMTKNDRVQGLNGLMFLNWFGGAPDTRVSAEVLWFEKKDDLLKFDASKPKGNDSKLEEINGVRIWKMGADGYSWTDGEHFLVSVGGPPSPPEEMVKDLLAMIGSKVTAIEKQPGNEKTPGGRQEEASQQKENTNVWAQAEAKIEAHLRGIDPKMRYEEVKSERLSKYLPEFRVFRGLERNTIGQSSLFVVNKNGEIKDFDNDDRQAIAGFMRARKIQVKNQEDAIALVQFFEELQGDTGYHNTSWKFTGEKKEGGWKVKITYVGDLDASIIMPPNYEMDIDEQGNFLDLRAIRRSGYIPTEE